MAQPIPAVFPSHPRTPMDLAAAVLGGRYTAPILWSLFWGGKKFFQILRDLHGVPRRSLALRLEELEAQGLVERRYGASGEGLEYVLSDLGTSLRPILGAMYHWGLTAAERQDAAALVASTEPRRFTTAAHD
jgi:DNA-binding HxlR family transcriptional regulator